MTSTITAVILAAGKGTRMKSTRSKVLHEVGGRPMIAHVVDAARAVATRLVVVVGPDADDVRAALGEGVEFAVQTEQRGTGDAVRAAAPMLGDSHRVIVLYGDVPLLEEATLQQLLSATPADALGVLTAEVRRPDGLGRILRDDAGHVRGIVEHRDASEAQRAIHEINTGIYVMPGARVPGWLERLDNRNDQGEYYITDVVAMAVHDGVDVRGVVTDHPEALTGINDRQQLAAAERLFQARQAEALMKVGLTLRDPARFDLRGSLECGVDCEIDVSCVIEGRVVLGDGVRIGAHCVIRDAEIGAGVVIEPFSHIDGARIGPAAQIGPYARLRPGTELADGVKIGNFVETKKTTMGPGSKANHLAYLGDASIGADCNIGAGTITCNYDGVDKHPTVMGDGVFVGSNSTLVAPVTLADGSYVGAGSTISKDVPADGLGVARARQRNIEHWTAPKQRPRDDDGGS